MYRASSRLIHARTVTLQDLRAELSDFINVGRENDLAIQIYLTTNFGLWQPSSSRPLKLRQGDKETDQCLSLQSVIMKWIHESEDGVYYMGGGGGQMQLQAANVKDSKGLKGANLSQITLGPQRHPPRDYQYTAIKAWKENWWIDLDTQITYNSYDGPMLLIRKYTCPEYDPDEYPTGTGIYDLINMAVIDDSFDVFSYKTSETPPREMCYAKESLKRWLKDNDRWPNTGETIPYNELVKIRHQLGVGPPVVAEGGIRCAWSDGGVTYRVVLMRDQVEMINDWQMRLPRKHYSAGFLGRVADWDFNTADDIPTAGPVRDRHNADLTRFD